MGLSKEEAIKLLNESEGDAFVVKSEDDYNKFVDNSVNAMFEKKIGDRIGEIHQSYDNDIKEITGREKPQGMKTYDHLKTVLGEFKSGYEKAKELEEKIIEYEKKGPDVHQKTIEGLKREVAEMKTMHEKTLSEKMAEMEEYKRKGFEQNFGYAFDSSVSGFEFRDDIPKNLIDNYITSLKGKILNDNKPEQVEGKWVLKNENGEIIRDDKTLEPVSISGFVKESLKDIVKQKIERHGTGAKPVVTDKDGKKDVVLNLPATVNSKVKLTEHLLSIGFTRGSEEYNAAYAKYSKDLKMR